MEGIYRTIPNVLEKEEEKNDENIEILNHEDGLFLVIKGPVRLLEAKERLKEYYYDEELLKGAIEKKGGIPLKIGERQYIPSLDGKITIRIDQGKSAWISLSPPHEHLGRPIRPAIFLREIEKHNITYGIDKLALRDFIKNPVYNKEVLIASYKAPTKGKDATYLYKFEEKIEVISGQILAIKEPPEEGEKGISIFGEEIPGIKGDDFSIIPGMNTYLKEDGNILFSQEKAEVLWKENRCDVLKILRIEGDCKDAVTFDGMVIIPGNVEKRTTIIAKGDIIVKGGVKGGVNISSSGSIYIDKSIVGEKDEEVNISAKNDVVCEKSCEMTNIKAGGIVTAQTFTDGNVRARRVFIRGMKGVIRTKGNAPPSKFGLPVVIATLKNIFEGGKISAIELVDTQEMGSSDMIPTEIEVEEGGTISIQQTIFPNSKIKIGKKTLKITKPLVEVTFKVKEGKIREMPYERTSIEMTKEEIIPRKKMKIEPPPSIVITHQSLLEAISEGARLLKIPQERLEFSLLREEKRNKTIRIYPAGMFGPWSEDWDIIYGEDKDGRFAFENRADGVYLIIYPPYGEGKFVVYEDVISSIKKEAFVEIDYNAINGLFKEIEEKRERKEHEIKIGPRQYLSDVSKIIKIEMTDEGKVEAIFYPPAIGGILVDMDGILKYLNKEGIREGIDQTIIKETLALGRFKEPVIIASPIPPIPGKDAFLEYKIKTKGEIKLLEDASLKVDFKETSSIVSVHKDDVLVIKHPLVPGVAGKKVTGEEIPPPIPKDVPLPRGKNTRVSDDGLSLISNIDGRVIFKDGKIDIDIDPVYEVKGDVCLTTGNIHFPGSIIIFGSVQKGFVVDAGGDVFIKGEIGGGIVQGGGKIEVKGGIRKAEVKGKNISCGFIENSEIFGDTIVANGAIFHSNVLSFNIKAKKILGGRLIAFEKISAEEIGGKVGDTSLYLGRKPKVVVEMEHFAKELREQKTLVSKLSLDMNYSYNRLPFDKKGALKEKINKGKERIEKIVEKIKALEDEEINEHAEVFVKNKVYSGTEITILNTSFLLLTEEKGPLVFKLKGGKIIHEYP